MIGYACLTKGITSIRGFKTCTVKTYSESKISEIIDNNLDVLLDILKYNIANNIYMFRISSDIIPLASHSVNMFNWKVVFREKLAEIGEYIKKNNIRVSMHPGQYTVLNSNNSDVVKRSIEDLKYHTDFLDLLGVDKTHKLILHVGGIYGDKKLAMQRFITNYQALDQAIKNRLVIENDDKLYNICDVLEISKQTNVPVVFDNLHHKINCCDQKTELEWIELCYKTWGKTDGCCKLHYSNQHPTKRTGAHSEFIFIEQFLEFYKNVSHLNLDIMLEVKDKNLSAIKCINCVVKNKHIFYEKQWANYKYVILEKSHNTYKQIREYLKNRTDFCPECFYLMIEKALTIENSDGGYRNSFDHVWGYFKKICTENEKNQYKRNLEKFNNKQLKAQTMKNFLLKLAKKYQIKYLLESYYFDY